MKPGVVAAAALGALAVNLVRPIPAADAPAVQAADTLDEIIVTGTRAKGRTVLDSPVPVDVLSAHDLSKTGAVAGELAQALQSLAPSFNFPRQSDSGGADHVRAGQLRGMSPDQVLVLVNGKRRHTSAIVNLEAKIGKGTTPVDFNSIPLNSIKRIEVLRDGAGAQYGSDAIAGVINIILDDSPSAGAASLSYGENITSFKPTHQKLRDGITTVAQLKQGFALGGSGFIDVGAEFRHRGSTNRAGFDGGGFFISDSDTPANEATLGRRNFAPGDGDARDKDIWYNLRQPLASGAEFYSFASYDHRDSRGAAFFRYPDSAATQPGVYPNGYRPVTTGVNKDLSIVGGLSGKASVWSWDGSLSFGQNKFDYGLQHSLNASLGSTSPTSFKIGDFRFDQLTLNLDATRQIDAGLAQPLDLAVGAEYRHEKYQTGPGDPASYAAGPFTDFDAGAQAGPGLQPGDAANASRTVGSIYADLSVHPARDLLIDVAGRVEHYDDFGNAVAGKLSGIYKLTPAFALRGAVSNSFRAPSLSQVAYQLTSTSFGNGGALTQVLTLPVSSPIARALGAQDLKAEKSVNLSGGFTLQGGDHFSLTADYFHIRVKDRITISERLQSDALTALLQTQFGLTGVEGVNFFTNAVDTRTSGFDIVANGRWDAGAGTFRLTGAYSYAKTRINGVRATPAQLAALDITTELVGLEERNTLEDAAPKNKTVLTAEWSDPHWSLLGRATRYGSATRVFDFGGGFVPTQTYSAKSQLDLETEYKFTPSVSLALGADNVLDTYPDLSSDDINYIGNFPYDVLSPIGMNGAFYYARIGVSW
ncbi:MAG: TonB-dependent receptor plug domain-containing protein [Steroidobacteraceae bacterium]